MEIRGLFLDDEETGRLGLLADLDGGWRVWMWLVPEGRRYVVAELRVFPEGGERGWDERRESVPAGGLPFRALREIRLEDIKAYPDLPHEEPWEPDPIWGPVYRRLTGAPERPGEEGPSPEERIALLAAQYVDLVESGEPYPNRVLAERWGRSAAWVTSEIYKARHRYDLLSDAPERGRAGGHLTDKGEQIIERLRRGAEEGETDA